MIEIWKAQKNFLNDFTKLLVTLPPLNQLPSAQHTCCLLLGTVFQSECSK